VFDIGGQYIGSHRAVLGHHERHIIWHPVIFEILFKMGRKGFPAIGASIKPVPPAAHKHITGYDKKRREFLSGRRGRKNTCYVRTVRNIRIGIKSSASGTSSKIHFADLAVASNIRFIHIPDMDWAGAQCGMRCKQIVESFLVHTGM